MKLLQSLIKMKMAINVLKWKIKKHACTPIPYIPENYTEIKIFKKPDYDILENCSASVDKILIMFDENSRSQCWEFRYAQVKNTFICRKCRIRAKILNENTDDEYVELWDANHVCQFVPFIREKYYQFKEFILPPDFEVQTSTTGDGREKKKLIIFDKNDRNQCYLYSFYYHRFLCQSCFKRRLNVSARLLQNSDGEDYVILSKAKHICQLRQYSEVSTKQIILRQLDFKLMKNTENGTPKLFIFDSNDRSLCYVFTHDFKMQNGYYCMACHYVKYTKSERDKTREKRDLWARVCKDEKGEDVVRLNDVKHVYKPTKYEPEKYAKKIEQKCYDYFFLRNKRWPNSVNVAFYHPQNKKLCFKFNYKRANSLFRCDQCIFKGKTLTIKIEKDENGKEYFYHDYKKHICDPVNVSSIQGLNFIMLKRDEIKLEIKNIPAIDESRIIKLSNFELHPNAKGAEDGQLFIFHSEDKSIGHKFYYVASRRGYTCLSTSRKLPCNGNAKLQVDENGEKYVILGTIEHKCEPVEFKKSTAECEEKNVITSNFITISANVDEIITNVIVFTTADHQKCYNFFKDPRIKSQNTFICSVCKNLNKRITVKLFKNENGQEYLQKSDREHVCQPQKYIKEKYEPKIIPQELFQLQPNTKNEANKTLIVFTSDKKDSVYEYHMSKSPSKNYYVCTGCQKKTVSATIIKNDGGNMYLKLGQNEHSCQPKKVEFANLPR